MSRLSGYSTAGPDGSTHERLAFDGQLRELALQLLPCGLTLNEARVYVYLLLRGPSPVKAISRGIGLHRVEVYRKLSALDGAGLLETYLDRPKRYAAVDPRVASSVLLREQESRLATFRRESEGVFARLDKLRYSGGSRRESASGPSEGTYRFVRGRRKYYDEMGGLVRRAEKEILRIVSPGGVTRTFMAGIDGEYRRAKARGVAIRVICEVSERNRTYARRLSRIVQLKHLDGVRLRFTLVDGSVTMLGAKFDEASQSLDSAGDSYIVFEDPRLSEAFRMFFEHLWRDARAVREEQTEPHEGTCR
ncbi:MAG: TrmB family transcriptional regulator [Nitrososphaerota archaeon]|nr:TrmB family transcriptional regulator [Nitrososphaerota archaeon]MDG7023134.1 TrmB family transcriptional regulator [Nitrososphaerota archaeon]